VAVWLVASTISEYCHSVPSPFRWSTIDGALDDRASQSEDCVDRRCDHTAFQEKSERTHEQQQKNDGRQPVRTRETKNLPAIRQLNQLRSHLSSSEWVPKPTLDRLGPWTFDIESEILTFVSNHLQRIN
jgi:hypothetical protein